MLKITQKKKLGLENGREIMKLKQFEDLQIIRFFEIFKIGFSPYELNPKNIAYEEAVH